MTATFLDDFIDKIMVAPNNINRLLRLIRKLDKRVEDIQAGLTIQQTKFTSQVKELREKKVNELPSPMKAEL
jgi:predicted transcriptional regulator